MSFHEVTYEEPDYEELLTRVVFDPEVIPIRSCLRPEDDLQSCYGPVQKKSVGFCDYFVVIPYVVHDKDYVDMWGYKILPPPRRSEFYRLPSYNFPSGRHRYQNYPPRFNASNIWDYENLFADTRLRSILKKMKSAQPKKAVHFALMQQNLAADDRRTETFVNFDPLTDS